MISVYLLIVVAPLDQAALMEQQASKLYNICPWWSKLLYNFTTLHFLCNLRTGPISFRVLLCQKGLPRTNKLAYLTNE